MFRIHKYNPNLNPKPDLTPYPTTNHGIITDIYITIKDKWGQIGTYNNKLE